MIWAVALIAGAAVEGLGVDLTFFFVIDLTFPLAYGVHV